ncbi:MAG: hypothetical protein HRU15_08375 [Planctomycetes bacterium]|nr:hypothetical protein [Planctomycetota bacterium]
MIFVQHIPWRVMALPTPPLLVLTLLPPLPFVYAWECLRKMWGKIHRNSCVRMLRCLQQEKNIEYLVVYSSRTSSQKLLEQEVWSTLPVEPVLWDNGLLVDEKYRHIASILPRELGNRFPLLISLHNGELQLHDLHDCVYNGLDSVMAVDDIKSSIAGRIETIKP